MRKSEIQIQSQWNLSILSSELPKKLPSKNNQDQSFANVSTSVIDQLKSLRNPEKSKPCQKRKKFDVEPEKSICLTDLEPEPESDSESSSSEEDSSADELSEKDSFDEDEKPKGNLNLKKIDYDTINADQWVKVIYEEEVFVGIAHKKGGEVRVQCLKYPFSIKGPQLLEHEREAILHKHVYHNDVTPKLKQFERAWQYVY